MGPGPRLGGPHKAYGRGANKREAHSAVKSFLLTNTRSLGREHYGAFTL